LKLPRDLSGPEIVRALQRMGFDVHRQRESHIRLVKGEARVTVPNHGVVNVRTLASILSQAGITIEDLAGNL
jgi:predicted RNA binding protein YcfA (HicA-like mRNA interferase family)